MYVTLYNVINVNDRRPLPTPCNMLDLPIPCGKLAGCLNEVDSRPSCVNGDKGPIQLLVF